MRLINVQTLQVAEHSQRIIPEYAILSHRWQTEEVSFQDINSPSVQEKKGYLKIQAACRLTAEHGLGHLWVDTCCIDKTSSAELSEAINSMYRWYSTAAICFAYLFDIQPEEQDITTSAWFTRGWTLQELIAPRILKFYDGLWNLLGTKGDLKDCVAKATGINAEVLGGARLEDRAYSLLGLFDVNMPLLYGEGEKAFLRLQEEIIKTSDDQSIFAWNCPDQFNGRCGLLATSPSSFAQCQSVVRSPLPLDHSRGYSITNAGLSIELLTIPWSMDMYVAIVECTHANTPQQRLVIFLERLHPERHDEQYARIQAGGQTIQLLSTEGLDIQQTAVRRMCVRQSTVDCPPRRIYGFWLRTLDFPHFSKDEQAQMRIYSRDRAHGHFTGPCVVGIPDGCHGTAGIVYLPTSLTTGAWRRLLWMEVGFDADFLPWCTLHRRWSRWSFKSSQRALKYSLQLSTAQRERGKGVLQVRGDQFYDGYADTSVEVKTLKCDRRGWLKAFLADWDLTIFIGVRYHPMSDTLEVGSPSHAEIFTIDIFSHDTRRKPGGKHLENLRLFKSFHKMAP